MTAPDELTPNTLRELAENEYVPTAVAVAMNMLASAWTADRTRIEELELIKEIMGWIVERDPAFVHLFVEGHHALEPFHDLPTFYRTFPAADLTGWMAKHVDFLASVEAHEPALRGEEEAYSTRERMNPVERLIADAKEER